MIAHYLRKFNYYDHPSVPGHMVFHFFKETEALEFERLLIENKIEFEKHTEEGKETIWLFGMKKKYEKEAVQLNFLAIGKFRRPFIPYAALRWLLYIFVAGIIVIALIGYFKK